MPSGITLLLNALSRKIEYRQAEDRPARPRDRSLHGKARVRARKAANRASRSVSAAA
jgi:hypothetical protein